ncbi:MAG TPA: hypothetical protein VH062_02060 [Polyangiaceae bacterium]|nr:hypothetical protein [Polyangiaceae bacterium]
MLELLEEPPRWSNETADERAVGGAELRPVDAGRGKDDGEHGALVGSLGDPVARYLAHLGGASSGSPAVERWMVASRGWDQVCATQTPRTSPVRTPHEDGTRAYSWQQPSAAEQLGA